MPSRFVDTSGWAAWADRAERFHSAAKSALDEVWAQGGQLVTTTYVLAELSGLFTRLRIPKLQQISLIDAIRADASVEVVSVDAYLDSEIMPLWRARPDKDWTLVDCGSFVVMQRRALSEAVTTDHHFEQAGFVRLLK
jgi:predicted nucleic acid-binding protein